ncbi:hypothetical protein AOL_s00117g23 [Orbilia oligospora ATCC 24927]|uniref:IMS import disulfide relay-system CHCH-CHCH-like Cx9C domain-containing protein n=1 Tax=Arthrobotrys oligospora (strain ATCC 24927 / CBS 115.81 / DSM 1491) TaxID=756982 RepID=G1XLX6_ARTOA|nr:hypothetical protein AOL_s00117g23 [Orbilia oligospora ATCC 24927]EGX45818.1 hypothetical protein AOL_s00117g23 [Orbilia oligospora ATCC 24927]
MPGSKIRPVDRLAQAVAKCGAESTAYGKCIVKDFNNVYKDKCLAEFQVLQNCVLVCLTFLCI